MGRACTHQQLSHILPNPVMRSHPGSLAASLRRNVLEASGKTTDVRFEFGTEYTSNFTAPPFGSYDFKDLPLHHSQKRTQSLAAERMNRSTIFFRSQSTLEEVRQKLLGVLSDVMAQCKVGFQLHWYTGAAAVRPWVHAAHPCVMHACKRHRGAQELELKSSLPGSCPWALRELQHIQRINAAYHCKGVCELRLTNAAHTCAIPKAQSVPPWGSNPIPHTARA